jgi:hypothetical protein
MAANGTTSGFGRVGACVLVALVLTSCASAPRQPAELYGPAGPPTTRSELHPAASVLNALALPLTVGLKAVVCAGTVVLGVPATAVLAMSDPEGTGWQRQGINDAFAENCSLPW